MPQAPSPTSTTAGNPRLLLWLVAIGFFMQTLDSTIVNTALPYELPILKARLSGYFPKAVKALRGDPKRQDAYIRACRLNDFLAPLTEVADDSIVPAGSLLREFIGGSRYPV